MMRQGVYISKEKMIRTYKDGQLHCDTYPAIYLSRDTNSTFEYWYKEGKLHREDGPAHSNYDQIYSHKYWYLNGFQHREDGPAVVWSRAGVISLVDWFLFGKRIPKCESVGDLKRFKLKAFL